MTSDITRHEDLSSALDDIVASYDGPEEINNLDSAALPNERKVIEAYEHLKPILYMGFYSKRSLNRGNLRYALSERLYPATEILVEQISRACTYEHRVGRCPGKPVNWSEEATLRLVRAIPRLRTRLNGDVVAAFQGDPAAASVEEVVFAYPSIEAITAYRIAHELHIAGVPLLPRIITEYAHSITGMDIHPGATVGERFFVDHGTGVVIGATCVIGNDVKLYQGVTLGALSLPRGDVALSQTKRHPTLEDEVTVYAGATILGGDTIIGRGSVVGGNVWLTRSLPPGRRCSERHAMSDDTHVARALIAAITAGDVAAVDALYHDDAVVFQNTSGSHAEQAQDAGRDPLLGQRRERAALRGRARAAHAHRLRAAARAGLPERERRPGACPRLPGGHRGRRPHPAPRRVPGRCCHRPAHGQLRPPGAEPAVPGVTARRWHVYSVHNDDPAQTVA
jgi:serine O-acetyltransferase